MTEEKFSNSEEYQQKVVSLMLHKPDFKDIAKDALKHEDFANNQLQWYFNSIAMAPIPLTPATLKEELLRAAKEKKIRDVEVDKYISLFSSIAKRPTITEEEYIQGDLGKFMKTQAMKRAIIESFELAEKGEWDTIIEKVTDATRVGIDILSLGQDYFGQYSERIARRTAGLSAKKYMTGIPELDDLLNGGIEQKQLGLVAGGTGRGKSLFLEWLGRTAILMGFTVVYYTLEIPEDKIGARYDSLFARVKMKELKDFPRDVEAGLAPYARFKNRLIIKEYPADTATVHTIKAHLRQLGAQGIRPDIVIVDYLDLLKPHRTYNSSHEELDAITKSLHGMAKELDVAIWTATQLNRSGITSETPDETSIAGALAKLFTVDIALFLAQTNEEREDERMRIVLTKNREGITGRTVKIDTDYSYMTFYRAATLGSP